MEKGTGGGGGGGGGGEWGGRVVIEKSTFYILHMCSLNNGAESFLLGKCSELQHLDRLASYPGPAQLSVTCSTEKQGESGIFSHMSMTYM